MKSCKKRLRPDAIESSILWGTSLLFAAVHMNLVTFVPLATLAVVLTMLYERTDNLLAPITAHVLFNALNFATLLVLQQTGGL